MIEAGANEIPEAKDDRGYLQSSRSKPGDHRIYRQHRSRVSEKRNTLTKAAQFRKSCLQRSKRSFLRKRWKKLYLPMINRQEKKTSVSITEKLEEAFAENEEWLAIIRRGCLSVSEKDCSQDDLKRPQTSGRPCDHTRSVRWQQRLILIPRVHGSAMFTRGQTQICNVCNTGSAFRSSEDWMDWMRYRDIQTLHASVQLPVLLCR